MKNDKKKVINQKLSRRKYEKNMKVCWLVPGKTLKQIDMCLLDHINNSVNPNGITYGKLLTMIMKRLYNPKKEIMDIHMENKKLAATINKNQERKDQLMKNHGYTEQDLESWLMIYKGTGEVEEVEEVEEVLKR